MSFQCIDIGSVQNIHTNFHTQVKYKQTEHYVFSFLPKYNSVMLK